LGQKQNKHSITVRLKYCIIPTESGIFNTTKED